MPEDLAVVTTTTEAIQHELGKLMPQKPQCGLLNAEFLFLFWPDLFLVEFLLNAFCCI
jgi:hypothetical protein